MRRQITITAYLVSRVRAQDVQRRGNQLGLDWDRIRALFLSRPKSFLDGIDPGRCIARQFDISTELDGLRSQSTRDCRHKKGMGGRWDGDGQAPKNSVCLAIN